MVLIIEIYKNLNHQQVYYVIFTHNTEVAIIIKTVKNSISIAINKNVTVGDIIIIKKKNKQKNYYANTFLNMGYVIIKTIADFCINYVIKPIVNVIPFIKLF